MKPTPNEKMQRSSEPKSTKTPTTGAEKRNYVSGSWKYGNGFYNYDPLQENGQKEMLSRNNLNPDHVSGQTRLRQGCETVIAECAAAVRAAVNKN